MKGELKIRKGEKNGLLGFYFNDQQSNKIAVRYSYKKQTKLVFYDEEDPIKLPIA